MLLGYLKLSLAVITPSIATFLLFLFNKKSSLPYMVKQLIAGLVFGGIAVLGTEFGVHIDNAIMNCRDAAPICAGLLFGSPAGIIAGLIGGLERWFCVYWQENATYTQLACSVSTALAGILSAILREQVFESKRPRLILSAICALMVEALHQSMVFFTHMDDAATAAAVVTQTAFPMILANTVSVLLAGVVYAALDGTLVLRKNELLSLSVLMERRLVIPVVVGFAFMCLFTYRLQTGVAVTAIDESIVRQMNSLANTVDKLCDRLPESDLNLVVTGIQPGFNGSLFVLDHTGKKLLSSSDVSIEALSIPSGSTENIPYSMKYDGQRHRSVWCRVHNYILLLSVPESTYYSIPKISTPAIVLVQLLIYGILFAQIYIIQRRSFVRSLHNVNLSLTKIAAGDLDTRLDERSSEEFAQLSDDINATVEKLSNTLNERQSAVYRDLSVAREIQLSTLPGTFPAFPNRKDLDIYALTQPAREVGGDFYDFYFANGGHFYVLIADVSGKGISAAMFMMRVKTYIKGLVEASVPIDEAFRLTNEAICSSNKAEMFVTAWMADIDMLTGKACFVNAGHNPPLIAPAGGSFTFLKTKPCLVLGGMSGVPYRKEERVFARGDRLVLYTDGVTEATNSSNELYGEERLVALLNANRNLPAGSLAKLVRAEALTFTGEADQFDDITLLVFDYLAEENEREVHFDATRGNMPAATDFLEKALEKANCPDKVISQLDVVLDEILANIVKYAYPDEPGPISLKLDFTDNPRTVKLTIRDEGIPFNPLKSEDPDVTLSVKERTPGGLGIYLVKQMTDSMTYEYTGKENVLILGKKL